MRERGFTLLELVVIIAVIGILAAAVSPSVIQRIMDARVEATQTEAQALYEAMVGENTSGVSFGFVGDIGRLPASFQELAQQGSLPSYTTSTARGIGMGWRGPYVNSGTSTTDYLTDAFGQDYTGASSGQVRSAGPDGVFNTADDIVYPPSAPTIGGTVTVTVKTIDAKTGKTLVDPNGYSVELHYASNGAEATLTDTSSPYSFTNVPMGVHAIRVLKNGASAVAEDTVVVRPGGSAAAELWF